MSDLDELKLQTAYFQSRLDELTGQTIKADAVTSRINRELRQRRQALAVLSELQRTITTDLPESEIHARLLEAIQKSLKMDHCVLLQREGDSLVFTREETSVELSPDWLRPETTLLAPKSAPASPLLDQLRQKLGIAFLVAVPIYVQERLAGLLVSGRQREMKPFFPPLDQGDVNTLSSLAGFLGSALSNSRLFQAQREMTESFRRFVPREFLDLLGRRSIVDVELGDQTHKTMSVMFSDIRSFTTLSERMTPKANFDFINRYLEFVAPAILENGGFIDKYIGDAIMALFPSDADSAVRAALGLHSGLERFNREWQAGGNEPLAIGAGVHTGALMLGTIGFRERMDTTVISDAVNLAARMEGLTKQYGAGLLITGETRAALTRPQDFQMRRVDRVLVKGKKEAVDIYEVYDCDEPARRDRKFATVIRFEQGISLYTEGSFREAAAIFEKLVDDGSACLLRGRCLQFLGNGKPDDWRGVVAMEK